MENSIIELLSNKRFNNLSVDEIIENIKGDKEEVVRALKMLEEEGGVFYNKSDKYILVSNTSLEKGIVKITKRRGAIVVLDNKELVISNNYNNLNNNDIVLVEPFNKNNTAKVVKLLKRVYKDYIGEVVTDGKKYKVVSKDKEDIYIKDVYPIGTRVLIDGKTHTIKAVAGHKDDIDTRTKEILLENGFPVEFSEKYKKELSYIPDKVDEEEINALKRKGFFDIRKLPLVTIDGSDTKDFDDAVGFVDDSIYISIANTTKYIIEKSAIWDETLKRSISVYPPGMVNPMMDHEISNGICSLIPFQDRVSLTVKGKLDDDGNIVTYNIFPSIMENKKRMTYEDVNSYLEDNTVVEGYEDYLKMIDELYDKAMLVKNNMIQNGFLDFTSMEVKIAIENNRAIDVNKRHQGKSEELVEFLMLLNNMIMIDYFKKHDLPFIARNHEEPNKEKLRAWNSLLKQRGYDTQKVNNFSREEIRKRQKLYENSPEKVVLDYKAIRSQAKAGYSATNGGHYALGLDDGYGTFSSPIRRGPDFINQRIYFDSILYGDDFAKKKWTPVLPYFAKLFTDAELRAAKVERKTENIRKAEYMSKFIGEEYTGIVLDINDDYINVILPNRIVGKVYIGRLNNVISNDRMSIVNKDTGERTLIGDSINVKIMKTDVANGEVVLLRESTRVKEKYDGKEKKGKKKIKKR